MVTWLDELNSSGMRTLARALSRGEHDDIATTFRQIKNYRRQPTAENLAKLTFQRVEAIKQRREKKSRSKNNKPTLGSSVLVDDLLSLGSKDDSEREQLLNILTEQGGQIVDRFSQYTEILYENDEGQNQEELLRKRRKSEEDALERFKRDDLEEEVVYSLPWQLNDQHPFQDATGEWVREEIWGGWLTLDDESESVRTYQDIVADDKLQPEFTPRTVESLCALLSSIDELLVEEGAAIDPIRPLFDAFDQHRRHLIPHRLIFLYYPLDALLKPDLFAALTDYLDAYARFSRHLKAVCRHIQRENPDTANSISAQFLALDTVLLTIAHPKEKIYGCVLTPLHPLQLWKWHELYNAMQQADKPLSDDEALDDVKKLVKEALQNLPSLLNTFTLHEAMFEGEVQLLNKQLVLAGDLENSKNDNTIGIPYFAKASRGSAEADGLKEFTAHLEKFLTIYPPARLGLSILIVDPPQVKPILEALIKLHDEIIGEDERLLAGAKVTVMYRDSSNAFEQLGDGDEDILHLFRTNPHWQWYDSPEPISSYPEALKELAAPPHLVLVCDPSDTIMVSVDRRTSQQITPFALPEQVTYDRINDSVKREPFPNDDDIFQLYFDMRHVLSGETARTAHAIGRKVNLHDLRALLKAPNRPRWLATLDFSQGSAQIEKLGHTLLMQQSGQRTLTIYTGEDEWEAYWLAKLQAELEEVGLPMPIDGKALLQRIGTLYPISEQGLLQLIKNLRQEETFEKPFNGKTLCELLGLVATLNWYRQHHEGAVVIQIDTIFRKHFTAKKAMVGYLICWLEAEQLHIDLVMLHTARADLRGLPSMSAANKAFKEHDDQLAKTLAALFAPQDKLITPLRQALFHRRLFTSIFATDAQESALLLQTRATKRAWEHALNTLFTQEKPPTIHLAHVGVALHDAAPTVEPAETSHPTDKRFARRFIRLSAAFLQPEPPQVPERDDAPEDADVEPANREGQNVQLEVDISADVEAQADELRRVLIAYGIAIAEVNTERTQIGARFVRYWVRLQPPHGRLSDLQKYATDIARELSAVSVPLIDNIPGEPYVGVDLPRPHPQIVSLTAALNQLPTEQPHQLMVAIGQNVAGEMVMRDLARLPHMLVAGHTGGGKSVFLASVISSLIWRHPADDLHLILVDPKLMDFPVFESLPHLHEGRVIYDPAEAIDILRWLMEEESIRRARTLQQSGHRKIESFYRHHPRSALPNIVVVIDEFADIMNSLPRQERQAFERQINRLAATGRARGIHLILATQRPTVDVVSGAIKANIPARVSFQLATQTDSRTILDRSGAETLLGRGDMLFSADNELERLQGYFATDAELAQLVQERS